jgi:hypothetical protein
VTESCQKWKQILKIYSENSVNRVGSTPIAGIFIYQGLRARAPKKFQEVPKTKRFLARSVFKKNAMR